MSMGSRLLEVIDCRDFHPIIKNFSYIYNYFTLPKYFLAPKNGSILYKMYI